MNPLLASNYRSNSQKIRVITERWVYENIFCANCGAEKLNQYNNNRPVADFYCEHCKEDYELKSKSSPFSKKITDGAYGAMIERLGEQNNPNFFLLNYDSQNFKVQNFFIIPKHFFVPEIIEKRKPLSLGAKRAGWVGCNILLSNIPKSGRIFYVKNGEAISKKNILHDWKKTAFLKEKEDLQSKTWLLDVLNCIDKIEETTFKLEDVYKFEEFLRQKHPKNKHIKDKIRQQLQFLRNKGYIEFQMRGVYKKTS